jgi:hypothetical protein
LSQPLATPGVEAKMSRFFSYTARTGAYLITFLLAAVWIVGALDTLLHPLYDLGRHHVGDVIIRLTGALGLSPHLTFQLAHLLAGLKLMVGALLLTAVVGAIYEKLRWGTCDDAILDVALFTAGIASVLAALPGLIYSGEPLQQVIGELMLCVIASRLAIYGRGYLVQNDLVRPAFSYVRAD